MNKTGKFQFFLTDQLNEEDRAYISQQIKAFNDATSEHHRLARQSGATPLDIMIRDDQGQTLGGLIGATYWDWLDIKDLWLDESIRRSGYGRELMLRAETEARARGCIRAMVKTFSFQARGFYEKLGYRVVGELRDYPPGQAFFWLRKDLPT